MSASLPWENLSVELPREEVPSQQENDNDVAMFVGLQVLDGSRFRVEAKNNCKYMVSTDSTNTRVHSVLHDARDESATDINTGSMNTRADSETEKKETKPKKKRKQKKRKRSVESTTNQDNVEQHHSIYGNDDDDDDTDADATRDQQVKALQLSWMESCGGGVVLHPKLCQGLLAQQFQHPTPIQACTLPASILGRHNIVGAAPTGSGKTLAYLLPILQHLLDEQQEDQQSLRSCHWRALILAPTRELANQITKECHKLLPDRKKWVGTLVGGLAAVKQTRILNQWKPPIVVATPGRLWSLISSGDYAHLQDLSRFQFLVVDEVDRMIHGKNDFPQLYKILKEIHTQEGPCNDDCDSDSETEDESDTCDKDQLERMLGLPGIRGEAKVTMLTEDVLEQVAKQKNAPQGEQPKAAKVASCTKMQQRQTFVFSATLTLPSASGSFGDQKRRKKSNGARGLNEVEGAIADILQIAKAQGPSKVVDLTSLSSAKTSGSTTRGSKNPVANPSSKLPPGLSLWALHVTQRHKDSYLYAYLTTTSQGASGPSLVFCNSIAAVRRVGSTLKTLKLPVRMLHAQMTQKARFKAIESLKQSGSRAIVVATDVAARGLDIPSVQTVVHYDVARSPDTFIHRAGRTARGIGAAAVGSSLSLVSPAESVAHDKIGEALGSKKLWKSAIIDGRLLSQAQERTALACKIVSCEDTETKAQKHNSWMTQAASDAGLDIDDDMIEDSLKGGTCREQHQLREAQQARMKLNRLLATPMLTQRFGKFLSSNTSALDAIAKPYVVDDQEPHRQRKKRM